MKARKRLRAAVGPTGASRTRLANPRLIMDSPRRPPVKLLNFQRSSRKNSTVSRYLLELRSTFCTLSDKIKQSKTYEVKKNHEPKESLCKNMPFTMFCCTYKWTARRQKFVQFMLMKCFELCFAHESVFWYLILISKCWYFDCLVDLAGGVEVFKRMT